MLKGFMNTLSDIFSIYPHPDRLSDPWGDFSKEELMAITSKKNSELGCVDFMNVFQNFLPAGEYCESVYYLPLVMEYITNEKEDYEQLLDHLLWWIGYFKDDLVKDKIYYLAQNTLKDFFVNKTSTFQFMASPNSSIPENGEAVIRMVEGWNSPPYTVKFGDTLIKPLASCSTYPQAAWACMFIKDLYEGYTWNSDIIQIWAADHSLHQRIVDKILEHSIHDDKLLLTWDKIMTRCGFI